MGFTHLHLHTEYSFLDGAIKIAELFKKIKELGQNSVAITEHGNMHAMVQKYKLAKKEGIKLIFGAEVYLCENIKNKDSQRYHLVLLAENENGLNNLIKIVSIANTDGFYYRPRVDKNILRQYSSGIIATSACIAGDIQVNIINGKYEKAKNIALEYVDIFGKDNFFLELHNHGIKEEIIANEGMLKIAKETGIKIIVANDAHYLNSDDQYAHEILLCIQTKGKIKDPDHFQFEGNGFYVKSEQEMHDLFPNNPEFITNTQLIADRCNVELDLGNTYFPEFNVESKRSYDDEIKYLCYIGFNEKYGGAENEKQAKERLEYELSVIQKMGFSAYFLIVADFIRAAKKFCQVGPGRGSGAGSIVAYLMGITQLEPLSLNLLFERFLNPERISLPDFDVDFGDRDKVLEYVKDKYGRDKVALIGTYGTMMAKAVLKDVARVLDISFDIANDMTKYVNEKSIQDSLDIKDENGKHINVELLQYKEKFPKLFEIAQRLEGTVRQPGIHACGVVWGPLNITDYVPVFKKDDNIVTQMDKNEVEERGLVKFDFLGLETLNIIQKTLEFIGKDSGWMENIPLDDSCVYKMLEIGNSCGVFQLESAGMQKTLKLVKPNCFDDIIAIVALYRPGPMQYLEVYANRKFGKEKVSYPHETAQEILEPTYGIMVYQEQVMQLAQKLAGFTMGEADVLRKAIGKKKLDLMQKMEGQFKDGCMNVAHMEKSVIDRLWDDIVKFASYSFNKSHAAAYALISYRTAYLKYYFPLEFYTALISSTINDPEKMAFYLQKARDDGINITPPHINKSEKFFSFSKNSSKSEIGDIIFGLEGVKNVGDSAVETIIENRPYESYQDFINKVDLGKVNKRVCKHLIMCGAFDNLKFNQNRNKLLKTFEDIKKEEDSIKQKSLDSFFSNVKKNVNDNVKDDLDDGPSLSEILKYETDILGLPVSGHLLDQYKASSHSGFDRIDRIHDDREFNIFVIVKNFKKIMTKNGENMGFLDVEDRHGYANVVIFPSVFNEINFDIKENMPLMIEGKKQDESLIAQKINPYGKITRISRKKEEKLIDDAKSKTLKENLSTYNSNSEKKTDDCNNSSVLSGKKAGLMKFV